MLDLKFNHSLAAFSANDSKNMSGVFLNTFGMILFLVPFEFEVSLFSNSKRLGRQAFVFEC